MRSYAQRNTKSEFAPFGAALTRPSTFEAAQPGNIRSHVGPCSKQHSKDPTTVLADRLSSDSTQPLSFSRATDCAPKCLNHSSTPCTTGLASLVEASSPGCASNGRGVKYHDEGDVPKLLKLLSNKDVEGIAAPHFAVSVLGVTDADGKTHYISQTPAQLSFLAPRLGLLGDAEKLRGLERDVATAHILQLCATALDLNNETHDTHHPISVSSYYEDQKEEAKKRSADFIENRLPKFFGLFEVALKDNGAGVDQKDEKKRRLFGSKTTVADLTVFQVVDGLLFAFPKALQSLKKSGKYDHVFALHEDIAAELKGYLGSDRRKPYSNGIFRHYPALDQEEATPRARCSYNLLGVDIFANRCSSPSYNRVSCSSKLAITVCETCSRNVSILNIPRLLP